MKIHPSVVTAAMLARLASPDQGAEAPEPGAPNRPLRPRFCYARALSFASRPATVAAVTDRVK
jgi:hypothetical protein